MTRAHNLLRWGVVGGAALGLGLAVSQPANAQVNVISESGLNIDFGVTAAVYSANVRNAGAGVGSANSAGETNTSWSEGYVLPTLYLTYDTGWGTSQIYGDFSIVASATRGDGDPAGFTQGNPEDIDGEDFFLGWRSGDTIWNENFIDVSYGKQEFHVGTDFLIGIGHFDFGNDGVYWLAPRYSFERAGLLRNDWSGAIPGLTSQVFYLESDPTWAETDVVGVNFDWAIEQVNSTIGLMYIRALSGGDPIVIQGGALNHRDDLNMIDVRYSGNPIASMPNWFFAGEFVHQWKDPDGVQPDGVTPNAEVSADAFYVDVGYTFAEMEWTPNLYYRFATFEGDDTGTGDVEGFDPLFYGFTDWGTWFIGEVTGEYYLFNNNFSVHQVSARAYPYENLHIQAMFFNFELDEPGAFGVTDDDWGNELNFIADWSVNDNMSISSVYGILFPGDGAEQFFGVPAGTDGDNIHVIEAGLWVWF